MSLHTCDGTFEGDRNCFVCGPGLEQQDKIDALQANTDSSQRRILELELEVKRLRSKLIKHCDCASSPCATADAIPMPALAEAYVRLRDAAKGVGMNWKLGAPYGQDALDAALAEISRLEKGE